MTRAKVFLERLQDVVYHITSLLALENILSSDTFKLSWIRSDGLPSTRGLPNLNYFLSVTRTKSMDITTLKGAYKDVILVLDGNQLNSRYRSEPFDWEGFRRHLFVGGDKIGSRAANRPEFEDRIWSDKPTIPNFHKYILEVHMFCPRAEDRQSWAHIIDYCKQKNIKLFYYSDYKDFRQMNKAKANLDVEKYLSNII
jgi:hypothetical protein